MPDYKPPVHILIRRRTDLVSDDDVVFLEKALSVQLAEVADAYGVAAPGVTFTTESAIVPSAEAAGMDLMDDDGVPEAIAHHGYYAGFPWSIIGVGETYSWTAAASHEALEYLMNLRLDQWALGPLGTRWPREIADPVESDTYEIEVEFFGQRRKVKVSNYVLPAYWKEDSDGPWDRLGTLKGPFTVASGGYAVVETDEGEIIQYGASQRHPTIRRRAKPSSRAEQIMRAHRVGLRHGAHF